MPDHSHFSALVATAATILVMSCGCRGSGGSMAVAAGPHCAEFPSEGAPALRPRRAPAAQPDCGAGHCGDRPRGQHPVQSAISSHWHSSVSSHPCLPSCCHTCSPDPIAVCISNDSALGRYSRYVATRQMLMGYGHVCDVKHLFEQLARRSECNLRTYDTLLPPSSKSSSLCQPEQRLFAAHVPFAG